MIEIAPTELARSGPPRVRRVLILLVATAAVLVLMALSLWVGWSMRSPEQAAADALPPPPSVVTVMAERRVLTEPVVLRGQVLPGESVKVPTPVAASGPDSVVTGVAVRKGQRVNEGRLLLTRSGEPMFSFMLPFRLYRDLTGGMTGPDVLELQKALRRLGYPAPRNGTLDRATQGMLARFYADRGFTAPPASAEAVTVLQQAQDALAAAQIAYAAAVEENVGVVAAKAALERAQKALAQAQIEAGPGLRRSAVVHLKRTGGKVTAVRVRVGDVLDSPDKVLFELDGTADYILAAASRDQVGLVSVGQRASIADEATDRKAEAQVERIGADPANNLPGGLSGFAVRLSFVGEPIPPSDGRTVRIDIAVAASAEEVLAVPVTAVHSRADGSTFVTVQLDDGSTVDATVTAGQVAGGWVEVRPADRGAVVPGTQVVAGGKAGGT